MKPEALLSRAELRICNRLEYAEISDSDGGLSGFGADAGGKVKAMGTQDSFVRRVRHKVSVDVLPRLGLATSRSLLRAYAVHEALREEVERAERGRDRVLAELREVTAERDRLAAKLREPTAASARSRAEPSEAAVPPFLETDVETTPTDLSGPYQALDGYLQAMSPDRTSETDRLQTAIELVLRGSREQITAGQAHYLDQVRHSALPVVDIGCGRGEFLALLRERGQHAVGVDSNGLAVQRLNEAGFDIVHADALEYVAGLADQSIAGFTAFQVIEHLPNAYLRKLLAAMHAKLERGGFVLLETVNPYCLETYRSFYLDPTHLNPVPKDLLAIMLRFYGFERLRAYYQYPIGTGGADGARPEPIFYQAYALLGEKA
jgi:SAM-dependent methyltransferase